MSQGSMNFSKSKDLFKVPEHRWDAFIFMLQAQLAGLYVVLGFLLESLACT